MLPALLLCLAFYFVVPAALAQDPAQLAAQQMQAQQQAQQAQLAQQQAQMAQQQATLAAQQSQQAASQASLAGYLLGAATPTITRDPASTSTKIVLRLRDRTRGATLFFTTDGWTPTPASTRYTGPITLDHTATVSVIAIAPGTLRSHVAVQTITLPASTTPPAAAVIDTLAPGTPITLVFTAPASSHDLRIGDPVPVALAEDLTLHGTVVARRLASVSATVTAVDRRSYQGLPGSLSFAVHSVTLTDGTTLPLAGEETLEGEDRQNKAGLLNIVPAGGAFVHGSDAVIPAGATLIAHIASAPLTTAAAAAKSH